MDQRELDFEDDGTVSDVVPEHTDEVVLDATEIVVDEDDIPDDEEQTA